jgi:acetyl-CoA carboxylase carboxyltransferase component
VVETEEECIRRIKEILYVLRGPENTSDPVERIIPELESIVPADNRKVYDMRKVLNLLCDNGEWIELKSKFGTGILVGLARIGGRAVAIIANQPLSAGGSVDAKGIRKCAAFLEFAVRRKLSLLVIQDHPGFLVGSVVERDGLIQAIASHANALETVDIPMVTLIIRKAYGAAYYFLGTGASGAQFVAGWPNAEISFMSPEIGAAIFNKHTEPEKKREALEATAEELRRGASIWDAAYEFWVDAVIMPEESRKIICHALDLLC